MKLSQNKKINDLKNKFEALSSQVKKGFGEVSSAKAFKNMQLFIEEQVND